MGAGMVVSRLRMELSSPTDVNVDGPWQITFNLVPEAGISYALSNAPVTRSGVTVQPLQVDVVPAGGELDGATGGARVIVRVSGLAPDMLLRYLANFDFFLDLVVGGSCGSGGVLELVLPNGQPITPGFVYPLGQSVPTTPTEQVAAAAQTIGPSGVVDLAALFYTPIPSVSSLILYMDQLDVQIAGAARVEKVSGPWEFQLRPSA